ncbi:DUF6177 family protein [Streptomyces sp. NPDC088555]|uniref:DUF6177 family protein n=1 Tax=Streptomyces sp. NPDC088555 TaxID=3365866 RepID=UPI00382A66B9
MRPLAPAGTPRGDQPTAGLLARGGLPAGASAVADASAVVDAPTSAPKTHITPAVGHRTDRHAPVDTMPELAESVAARHNLATMIGQLRTARADLTTPAHHEPPPVPFSFALGPDAVADRGGDDTAFAPTRPGRPACPAHSATAPAPPPGSACGRSTTARPPPPVRAESRHGQVGGRGPVVPRPAPGLNAPRTPPATPGTPSGTAG